MQPTLIKYCRLFCNLTQKDVAELIGVHDSLVSKIESGTVLIQAETEQKLLEVFSAFGMDADTILKVKQMINEMNQKG